MKLFDSHCHLHFPQFDADRADVIARMQERDMGAVLIGTDLATSRAALELAQQHPFLWAAVGLHPNDTQDEQFDISNYSELAGNAKVVAIGECGLDYFRGGGTPEEQAAQKVRLRAQMDLAERVGKPLVIHCRDSQQRIANSVSVHDDMLDILEARKLSVPVIIHFFTGSGELAERYLSLGCYLSFPGPVTYADMYDDAIRTCPMDRLLIETDAPFAAPVPHRGKRNEPAFVEHVAAKIAVLKGVPVGEIEAASVGNARSVFRFA